MRPFQITRTGVPGRASMPSASRRTRSPSRLTIVTVTRPDSLTVNAIRLTSRRPSPLGEKKRVTRVISATDSAPLRRWATKNAPNVAATSSAKTTRASRVNARAGSAQGALSLPTTTATVAPSPASACVSASIARRSEMSSSRPMSRA